eukprot:g14431.t1
MTGTPLQNDMLELWALLHFIEPEIFSNAQSFIDEFGEMKDANALAALHDRLRPYMLRRLKEDVEKSIPAKEETVVNVELTIKQKKYYRAIFERNRNVLTGGPTVSKQQMGVSGEKRKLSPSLINLEMQMRKCCCHPYMIDGVEANETNECSKKTSSEGKPNTRANQIEHMIHCSGKMILLHKLLPKLRKEGHRILIFSQFREMFARASKKLGLSTAVFRHGSLEGNTAGALQNEDGDSSENGGGMMSLLTMDKGEVEMLLRYGAYAILDQNDSSSEQFTEATIEKLLEKSTTIKYGNGNNKDSDAANMSNATSANGANITAPSLSLAKASFMASTEDGTVNFGDDNFWEKVLGPKPV